MSFEKHLSLKKLQKNMDERLTDAEKDLVRLIGDHKDLRESILPALFKTLQELSNHVTEELSNAGEFLNAVVQVVGEVVGPEKISLDRISQVIIDKRRQQTEEIIANNNKQFTTLVESGDLVQDDITKETSVVVLTEYKPTGEKKEPSRFPLPVLTMPEQVKQDMLNKKVGDRVTLEGGTQLEINEIYKAKIRTEVTVPPPDAVVQPTDSPQV